ncbi:D-alanyl-D-alanine carboxypeptidase (penicillin-binding protein 5/6) [Litorivivens lipolytica]|uniref:serine-type D-Ala-D-Ala carboxypeptidase n=1 Tax=Litorivivens lipolytica TaxID=1524264 RepID=A0A7W4W493_9GAMM|nr:D-alanyl-D-alanine carboxypeptidase family protein [Litorivivens lipolytica]MBB3047183.1 D-alanyl-D-alanine carboxypeptidase (penicillin-binding protein 5/6) [Litorivivens lipolytica]
MSYTKHLLALLFLLPVLASAQPSLIPAPPQIAAKSWILMDADSGEIITEHNADERLPPASLTKLMTSYVLSYWLENGQVTNDDMVTISKNAWAQNPVFKGSSLMWIEVGKQVALGDLHRGIVVSSGNDASVAVAEYIAGSEKSFAEVMNQHAYQLGMKNTHFVNSHGLPHEEHYSSARDMALLAKGILEYPKEYALYSEREYTYNGIRQTNRNRLLWSDPSVDGLKTGHTEAAGYCLVSSAEREGMRLISVVMGAKSESARERETQRLLAYGFRFFETHHLYTAGTELSTSRVWKGAADNVSLGVKDEVYLTIPRGKHNDLEATLSVDDVVTAPVSEGQEYGELVVSLEGEELVRAPLVALQNVEEGGLVKRLWDAIVLFVLNLIGR